MNYNSRDGGDQADRDFPEMRRGNTIVVLLCGGDKGSQEKDIKTALRLAAEWSE